MTTFHELEYSQFLKNSGKTSGTINELKLEFFRQQIGREPASVNDGWIAFLQKKTGANGSFKELFRKYAIALGISGVLTQNEMMLYFYQNDYLTPTPDAPSITSVGGESSSPASATDSTPDVVVGSVVSGDTVTIYDGSTEIGSGTASGTTITITSSELTEAEHSITAKITRSGKTSAASTAFVYTVTPAGVPSTLLINFNGTDAATTYTAETGQTVSFVGGAQLDTADKKFGTASLLLDGDGDAVSVPDSANWDFGSGNFTIDFWIKFNEVGTKFLFSQYSDDSNRLLCYTNGEGLDCKLIKAGGEVGSIAVTSTGFGTTAWHHVAYVRNGDRYDFYVDGVSKGNTTDSSAWANLTSAFYIGGYANGVDPSHNGWIDSFRITKGTALWTTNFSGSLPTEPTS